MEGKLRKSDADWRKQLTAEQYAVTRQKATEPPFTGTHYLKKETGIYHCVCCGNALFVSDTKYESGTGWPRFWEPVRQWRPPPGARLRRRAETHGTALLLQFLRAGL